MLQNSGYSGLNIATNCKKKKYCFFWGIKQLNSENAVSGCQQYVTRFWVVLMISITQANALCLFSIWMSISTHAVLNINLNGSRTASFAIRDIQTELTFNLVPDWYRSCILYISVVIRLFMLLASSDFQSVMKIHLLMIRIHLYYPNKRCPR